MLVAALIGVVAAIGFRKIDGKRYINAGVPEALLSPTKLWHDWVVMPVVTAWLIWLVVPQLFMGSSGFPMVTVMFLALFGGLLVIDAALKPDPVYQHPRWDPVRFEAI